MSHYYGMKANAAQQSTLLAMFMTVPIWSEEAIPRMQQWKRDLDG